MSHIQDHLNLTRNTKAENATIIKHITLSINNDSYCTYALHDNLGIHGERCHAIVEGVSGANITWTSQIIQLSIDGDTLKVSISKAVTMTLKIKVICHQM